MSLESIYKPKGQRGTSALTSFLTSQAGAGAGGQRRAPTGGEYGYQMMGPWGSSFTTAPGGKGDPTLSNIGGIGAYNLDADPIVQEIRAAGISDEAQAENAAKLGRRQRLLALGDRDLASRILGADDPTLGAITDDPDRGDSILARLKRAYRSTVKENEDQLNEANLFYGGYRLNRLKDLEQQNLEGVNDAESATADALSQIAAALLAKKNQIRDANIAAERDAANNRLTNPSTAGGSVPGTNNGAPPPTGTPYTGGTIEQPSAPPPSPAGLPEATLPPAASQPGDAVLPPGASFGGGATLPGEAPPAGAVTRSQATSEDPSLSGWVYVGSWNGVPYYTRGG